MIDAPHQTFVLPDLGEGLTEAEIVTWRVAEGDEVGIDDVLVEVETAKATVEVPCPYAGRVLTLHAQPGEVVAVGRPLVSVAPLADPVARAVEAHRVEERAGSGAVLVGYGTAGASVSRRTRRRRSPSEPSGPSSPRGASPTPGAPRVISPVVRRLARERGVDVAGLAGTGPAGVILRRDVEAARGDRPAEAAPVPVPPTTPASDHHGDLREPLRGVRRLVAEKLARSRREIPDATTWVDVDATGLIEARDALRTGDPDRRVGIMALLARIVVAGLARFPELNASVEEDPATGDLVIVRHALVNLGFAAQTERGLVVPVIKDAGHLTTAELGAELARLTDLARAGTLGPEHLTGGTFTLNNYGVFGVDGSTPIINHPEAALLGVGRIVDKPWVVDGALAVRKLTQLSLTFDHRVCDGGTAGGFLRYVADCVERPLGLLADL
ncbi:MAG TPA: dihydrolipoamide acetyltransferase family protein [Jiangellaceae bacterium]